MTDSSVTIHFDDNGRSYGPGETLSGDYRMDAIRAEEIKVVEVSVLWHTHGKGDEDLAVHHFERIEPDEEGRIGPDNAGRFRTVLPNSPLTYEGLIVKLAWCVRIRVFLTRGREVLGEKPFRLGEVAAAKVESP